MEQIIATIFAIMAMLVLGLIEISLLKYANKEWWQVNWIKRIAVAIPLFGIISIIIWSTGHYFGILSISQTGAMATSFVVITIVGLIITFPFSALLNFMNYLLTRRQFNKSKRQTKEISLNRRRFLKGSAIALPSLALASGTGGMAGSFENVKVFKLPMVFNNLPPQLEGLRILHLTDSHLGIYKELDHFEEVLFEAEKFHPDLIVLTGDIADDLNLLPDVLKMTASFKTRYGTYACLGNHEYYRGIKRVYDIYGKSSIPLLVGSGKSIDINGVALFLAGADDPRSMGSDYSDFLYKTISKAINRAPEGSFKVLICHRPDGFRAASQLDIDLTLAGHTHGGQIGFGGRSIFANIMPDSYLWGEYINDGVRMYLSSGIGHWFPFRLGCPPEAPVIELVRK